MRRFAFSSKRPNASDANTCQCLGNLGHAHRAADARGTKKTATSREVAVIRTEVQVEAKGAACYCPLGRDEGGRNRGQQQPRFNLGRDLSSFFPVCEA